MLTGPRLIGLCMQSLRCISELPPEKLFQVLSGRLQAKRLYSFESEGTELVCDDDCLLSAPPAALTRLCIEPCRIYETLSSTSLPGWCTLTPKMQGYQIMHHHVERKNK